LPGQLLGQSTRVCFASEAEWLAAGERAHAGIDRSGKFIGEIEYRKSDGTPIWCQVTGSLLDPDNRDEGHVWLYEDVSARRAAEEAFVESLWEQQLIFDNAMIGISYRARTDDPALQSTLRGNIWLSAGGAAGQVHSYTLRQSGGVGGGRARSLSKRPGDRHF
jgi:PAS domain-containing protein